MSSTFSVGAGESVDWERLRMAGNDWEQLRTPVFFKGSRSPEVSWSRSLAVLWSRWRATQPFSAILSLSQSFSANRAPLSRTYCNPLNKKIGASQTRGSEMKVILNYIIVALPAVPE